MGSGKIFSTSGRSTMQVLFRRIEKLGKKPEFKKAGLPIAFGMP
jgi:hypothetical protein